MGEGVFLSKRDQFRYRQIVEFQSGRISREETARLLALSVRSVTRLSNLVQEHGLKGIVHGNRGVSPSNKLDEKIKAKVLRLVGDRYFDFNMLHCLEVLKSRHKLVINRETFRQWCHEKQLVKRKKKRRSRARHYRSRMPAEGYLLQMDGSPHKYNGRDVWSLILAIDDATSEIPYAEFFEAETTAACMKVLRQIILKKGIPRALYVDKAGWAGGGKRIEFTQFHRACEELGIQVLYANSPQAKGRVERAFDTFQDRIIPELRLARIKSMKRANRYLLQRFLPSYWNRTKTVQPQKWGSEYRTSKASKELDEILCFKKQRAVANNDCISVNGDIYQLLHPQKRCLAKKRVELRYYDKKPFAVFLEGTRLMHQLVQKHRKQERTWEEHIQRLEQR